MFISLVFCIGPLILILFELTFPTQCTEYDTKCYTVGNRNVCFFRPEFNYVWETWYKATTECKRNGGTLPFIPDKATQDAFEEYINSLMHKYSDDLWMAGREVRRKEWTWSNGLPFNEPTYFTQTYSDYHSRNLQAILTDGLVYRKEFLGDIHNYICQFFGEACKSNDSIPLKNGCVILNDGEPLDLYDARNKCVEKGADLAVIDGEDDLKKFRQVFSRMRNDSNASLWVGLRRQWWMWNVTDTAEVKYTNWFMDNGFKPEGECMVVAELENYLWKQENCSAYKRFICQTGPSYVEVSTTPTPTSGPVQQSYGFLFLVVGVSCLALTILLVIIVVAVIVKQRKARLRQTRMEAAQKQTSYQGLDNPNSKQKYTELHPPTRKPPQPTTDRPLKTEQNPDYIYDEIL